MNAGTFDETQCELGEGPLWLPDRGALAWFDILGNRMFLSSGGASRTFEFGERASAAGRIDEARLLVASETRLFELDLETGAERDVCALEADDPATRSNDGRADPAGGFWIGTMGKEAEPGAGAIYRWFRGELRRLFGEVTIPNSICFAPDGARAYFADTPTRRIMAQPLDGDGWPDGPPDVFVDLNGEGLNPDGSVTDAAGNLWNAQWGASRVACYAPDGTFLRTVGFPARHTSCPAFGGADLSTLYCTTAREHLPADVLAAEPEHGRTYFAEAGARGWPEPRVAL